MIIDLRKFRSEFEFYIKAAADQFLEKESAARLRSALEKLTHALDSKAAEFAWETAAPIRSKVATRYDGLDKRSDPVRVALCFHSRMTKVAQKGFDWRVNRMVTHLQIFHESDSEKPILHFHIDKKDPKQLGPDVHLQVSEKYVEDARGFSLAVPRIPFGFVLPTECLDFALAEFFGAEWIKAQDSAHSIAAIRNEQVARAERLVDEVQKNWKKFPKQTPVSLLQNYHFPDLRLA